HELRTPLAALQLNHQTLERSLLGDPEISGNDRVRERVERSGHNIGRLERLIEMLLDVSRITSNRFELELETFDLEPLVREVTARFHDSALRVGSELSVTTSGPLIGRWDRLRIDQVLSNLLANAIKYGRGRPIEVNAERSRDLAQLSV